MLAARQTRLAELEIAVEQDEKRRVVSARIAHITYSANCYRMAPGTLPTSPPHARVAASNWIMSRTAPCSQGAPEACAGRR